MLYQAADPATVRPLNVLEKTFNLLRKKWRKEGNYSYICEQFKSMRQDLTVKKKEHAILFKKRKKTNFFLCIQQVQRIQNEFTVKVYESHARIALEKVNTHLIMNELICIIERYWRI